MIVKLHERGCMYKEIGKMVGCNARTVVKIIEKYYEDRFGIRMRVFSDIVKFASECGVSVEDIFIGLMIQNGFWESNTQHHTDEFQKKKISEVNNSVLNKFVEMSKVMGMTPNAILNEMLDRYRE